MSSYLALGINNFPTATGSPWLRHAANPAVNHPFETAPRSTPPAGAGAGGSSAPFPRAMSWLPWGFYGGKHDDQLAD